METGQTHSAASSYLRWSIFSTLCCCLPLGIAAIVYSNQVSYAIATGDTVAAANASRKAKILNIIAAVLGVTVNITALALTICLLI
ncbi:hypothetical protein CRENBAI_010628 [Crenichthys baileyi]|uniref:Uncharacterized protein n=1 Tax=Crenichthys baileyi TaxID=28760 RepID=A0AAV9S0N2_9TELE